MKRMGAQQKQQMLLYLHIWEQVTVFQNLCKSHSIIFIRIQNFFFFEIEIEDVLNILYIHFTGFPRWSLEFLYDIG